MEQETPVVRCNTCGRELKQASSTPPAERKPCSSCGSTARTFDLHLTASFTVRTKLAGKVRNPSSRRPFLEFIMGDDQFRRTGQWNTLERVIDRRRDYYREIIRDPAGNIIHYCEERLSEHRGHGLAVGLTSACSGRARRIRIDREATRTETSVSVARRDRSRWRSPLKRER